MPRGVATEDSETRFWLRTVAVGGWVTLLMCLAGGVYAAGFASAGNRLALGVLVALTAALGALTLWAVPWRRVIASPWREAALLSWSALTIGTIAVMAALDGGAGSPVALTLLLPAVFASLAYELRRVFLIGALAELAYLMLTLVGSPGTGYVLVFCSVLGGTIVMAVGQAGFHQEWRLQLARSSRTDPLTGLLNRRGLAIASARSFHELFRRGSQVTLLLLDLDLFKNYNDTHGHRAGDELLRWVGAQLSATVRPSDSVARLGGDEFAVLLPDTDRAAAEPLIRRLREALGSRIPCCVGCATAPEDGTTFDDLYRVGDSALYRYKLGQSGRPFAAEAILAGIPEAFFVLDDECRFAYANPAAGRLFGRSSHDLLGRGFGLTCPDPTWSRLEQTCRRVAGGGDSERLVESWGPPDATFSVRVNPIPGGVSVQVSRIAEEAGPRAVDPQSIEVFDYTGTPMTR
jgi:diguanylate cyclase (GGDEF)-like protein